MAFEGLAERGHRLVSRGRRRLLDHRPITKHGGGPLQAPFAQVLHRRVTDSSSEPDRKSGARQPHLRSQFSQRPWLGRLLVHESEGGSDSPFAESAQPTEFPDWECGQVAAHDVDEKRVAQTVDDRGLSGTLGKRLVVQQAQRLRQPQSTRRSS